MSTLTTTLLPIATLGLGAALTMIGQSLTDRRVYRREKEARKEQFRAQNFEIHRTALLDLQEKISDLSSRTQVERLRRKTDDAERYLQGYPFKNLRAQMEEVHVAIDKVNELASRRAELSEEDFRGQINELVANCVNINKVQLDASREFFEKSKMMVDNREQYYADLLDYIRAIRLGMYRSGANSVVVAGQEYLSALGKWNDAFGDNEKAYSAMVAAECGLQRAISNRLTSGPYDEYEHQKNREGDSGSQ
ncbi:hypothetical protein [Actinomadura luteofluorescens]